MILRKNDINQRKFSLEEIDMHVIAGVNVFEIDELTVVTIGKFDGRHQGHQKILNQMQEIKQKTGCKLALFSFDMAPAGVVTGIKNPVLTTTSERRINLEQIGVDYLVEYPFTPQVAHMDPEQFICNILVGMMQSRYVVVGTDCGFGYRRGGNVALLKQLEKTYGYETIVVEKKQDCHRDISSTYIREEIAKGNMEKVTNLLGEPYYIHGTVVKGNQLGATLGFPTANILPPQEKQLPPFGVYATEVVVDHVVYKGVSNIGKKPTIEGEYPVGIETYIMDFDQDVYGKTIEVRLLHFLRPEKKFDSIEELKSQIEKDKKVAKSW